VTNLSYMRAAAYKHLHQEQLLLDRLVADQRRMQTNFDDMDESNFRMEQIRANAEVAPTRNKSPTHWSGLKSYRGWADQYLATT
jgi:hypothetical protein